MKVAAWTVAVLGVGGAPLAGMGLTVGLVASAAVLGLVNVLSPSPVRERLAPLTLVVLGVALVLATRVWVVPRFF